RKGGAGAKRASDTNEASANRTSIRQSVTVSQTGTGLRVPDGGGHRGGGRPKFSLALKFAVPVAAVVILAFVIAGIFIHHRMANYLSQEIVKSGVAQVTMLATIGRTMIDKSDKPNWPVEMGFIAAEDAKQCWEEFRGKDDDNDDEMKRTLCIARNGALLRRFIEFADDNNQVQGTQTIVAYVFSNRYGKNYALKSSGVGLLASSKKPDPDLAKDFMGEKAGKLNIATDWSWLPGGFKVTSYFVGNRALELGEDHFCDVYPGTIKKTDKDTAGVPVLAFQMPITRKGTNDAKAQTLGQAIIGIAPDEVIDAIGASKWALIIIGLVTILFAVFTCLFVGFQVVQPIEVLIDDMDTVAGGKLSHKSHVSTNDEIGMLASQFNAMTAKLQGAVLTEKKIAAVESELDIAREIQRKLLPEKLPQVKGMDIFATYHPAKEVGGDYYDFFPIDATHIGIIVADVSGKGVPGSMVMGTTRTILRFVAAGNLSSADTLKRTNSMVAADIKRGMFVTAFYLVLDVANRSILCSSAGHNPMVLIHADGNYDLINPNGIALGFDKGRIFDRTIKEQPIALRSGDRIVLYTDGVVEAMNLANEEYTDERFYTFVQNHFMHDSETFVNELLEDLNAHKCSADTRGRKAEQHDDITIVTFRVL
ncbi:MAG: SpoIIE family protein phosphatase, partial [Planctomycetes bacterium]|nr:SpoIIE family protein phosphatase [Planctomycetota bacterium]